MGDILESVTGNTTNKEDKNMKAYGMNKATEFTKKQISVIYGMAKRSELKVEKWVISEFYDLAEYYGYDSNGSVELSERTILNILNAVFDKDIERAQKLIDWYTEVNFERMTKKAQDKANRSLVA